MSLSTFERRQHRSVFFQAGQHAFLIGVPREHNPYKDQPARDAWDKGHRSSKERYRTVNRFYADVKLATLLGTVPPTRPVFKPRYQAPRQQIAATRVPRTPTLQQKFQRHRQTGPFTVGRS